MLLYLLSYIINMKQLLQTVRGTSDILPNDQDKWNYVCNKLCETAQMYGFDEIITPYFEYSWIYTKGIGEQTDIVSKEMYYLRHKDADMDVALRPEGTAGVVRAYYEHGLHNKPSPLHLFYLGAMFRHERPQKGRTRQFYQFGIESIGDSSASEDALIILNAAQTLNRLGIKSDYYNLEINSIGCKTCRTKYLKILSKYLKDISDNLCEQCQIRAKSNPMRVLDCKNKKCKAQLAKAPVPLDSLCSDCASHFKLVLEYLEEAGVKFIINHTLARGLDYYTKTVFEFISKVGDTKGLAIAAGGRYDNLVAKYGRKDAPAVGYGMGVERLIKLIDDKNISLPFTKPNIVYIIQLGKSAKKKAFNVIQELTSAGIYIKSSLSKSSLKSQLKAASKAKARLALIVGQRELLDDTIILKDIATGSQETLDQKNYIPTLIERLK